MPRTIGYFDFKLLTRSASDEMPFKPSVSLHLKQWHTEGADGSRDLATSLMTDDEIFLKINALKEDLDAVCARAVAALHQAQIDPKTR